MAVYNLSFKASVQKDLRKIPPARAENILKKIEQLANEAIPAFSVKLSRTDHTYRIRVGDYRVIYSVEQAQKQVIILYIRHRRDVYRSF